jgi:hypothetical protein
MEDDALHFNQMLPVIESACPVSARSFPQDGLSATSEAGTGELMRRLKTSANV